MAMREAKSLAQGHVSRVAEATLRLSFDGKGFALYINLVPIIANIQMIRKISL